jgi:hypothetical protein
MVSGIGLPTGSWEGTQWTRPPQRHRTSLDDDLDGASGDGDDGRPGLVARIVARLRRLVRRR